MSPDQPPSPDADREGERPDDHREAERQQAEREEGAGGEGERGFRDDLKEFPGELREESRRVHREADDALSEKMDRQPAFERALDLRIVLASVVIALVLALILRLLGVSRPIGVIIFFIALAGVWIGLARFYSARRPTSRSDAGGESQERDEQADGEERDSN